MKPNGGIALLITVIATINGSSVFAQARPPSEFESADQALEISVTEDPEQWLQEVEQATAEELKAKIQLTRNQRIQALRRALVRAEAEHAAGIAKGSFIKILELQTELAEAEYEADPTPQKRLGVKKRRWEAILRSEKELQARAVTGAMVKAEDNLNHIISQRLKAEVEYLEEVAAQRAKQEAEK